MLYSQCLVNSNYYFAEAISDIVAPLAQKVCETVYNTVSILCVGLFTAQPGMTIMNCKHRELNKGYYILSLLFLKFKRVAKDERYDLYYGY